MDKTMTFNNYTVIGLFLVTPIVNGCGSSGNAYYQTHLSAKSALPIAVEMELLFGSADHFITHYGFSSEKTNTWNSEVFFGDRYELTMQVEITIDYARHSIQRVGDPVFYLTEVTEVRLENIEGVEFPSVSTSFGCHTQFSEKEWEVLYKNHGDFSKIGIELNLKPVENFAANTDALRRPRIPISLISK